MSRDMTRIGAATRGRLAPPARTAMISPLPDMLAMAISAPNTVAIGKEKTKTCGRRRKKMRMTAPAGKWSRTRSLSTVGATCMPIRTTVKAPMPNRKGPRNSLVM